ncbi:hypothetical protein CPB83DRAFT_840250 [Crepidotus variabilis]|uniref:Uncharacterized protein n=1 Tax=Crepidotus variabilis TaxID=179855 RepID=A0A9P6E589_9AGAR|nr:hypothetical protein CPB83DRAFT_840250 [Crepidotus variabilis]
MAEQFCNLRTLLAFFWALNAAQAEFRVISCAARKDESPFQRYVPTCVPNPSTPLSNALRRIFKAAAEFALSFRNSDVGLDTIHHQLSGEIYDAQAAPKGNLEKSSAVVTPTAKVKCLNVDDNDAGGLQAGRDDDEESAVGVDDPEIFEDGESSTDQKAKGKGLAKASATLRGGRLGELSIIRHEKKLREGGFRASTDVFGGNFYFK